MRSLAALLAAGTWLLIASYFGWPVSTTHSIVGAILGFGIVYKGFHAIYWGQVGTIAASWIVSPSLALSIASWMSPPIRTLWMVPPASAVAGENHASRQKASSEVATRKDRSRFMFISKSLATSFRNAARGSLLMPPRADFRPGATRDPIPMSHPC